MLLAACGSAPAPPLPAETQEGGLPLQAFQTLPLALGEWRAEPIPLDPLLERKIVDDCRNGLVGMMGRRFPWTNRTVVDARGGGLAFVAFVFDNGGDAGCFPMPIENGRPSSAWGTEDGVRAAAPGELTIESHGEVFELDSPPGRAVVGGIGAGIERVLIAPAEGEPVLASAAHGRYLAWWPESGVDGTGSSVPDFTLMGLDAAGREVFSCTVAPAHDCLGEE